MAIKITALTFALTSVGLAVVFTSANAPAATPGPFGSSSLLSSRPLATEPKTNQAIVDTSTSYTNTNPDTRARFNCSDLRRAAMRMSVHASNLANRNTTRTQEGGPYRRLETVCRVSGAFCNIVRHDDHRAEYQPTHPDADTKGYVKYPSVNTGAEWAGLNTAATELKMLASQGVCAAKTLEQGEAMIVKYHESFDVLADTITFSRDGKVATWSRTARDGKSQNLAFGSDGLPVGM
ncbi:MAG: hypothetical protein RBT63_07380 [Bdellovibrionales bacterium]|jgi:flagellar basal-body rod protein FlgC|nr:hypothetical protein [Bdellovibrionales bacterium]